MNAEEKDAMGYEIGRLMNQLVEGDKEQWNELREWQDGRVGDNLTVLNRMMAKTVYDFLEMAMLGLGIWCEVDTVPADEVQERAGRAIAATMALMGTDEVKEQFGVLVKPPGGVG